MSSRARYLILTPNVRGRDGVSRLTRSTARALVALGGEVDVWSLTEPSGVHPELDGLSFRVRGAGGSKLRAVLSALAHATTSCRDLTVIVMHAHLAPLSLMLQCRGARVFQILLGIEVWKRLTAPQAMAFRKCERLVCISEHTRARFEDVNPGFQRSVVCHLGLPDAKTVHDVVDGDYALVVGRMAASERYKGHDLMLDVWKDVLRDAPGAKLVIVGEGDDRERLAEKARNLGLSHAVRFTGAVSDGELDELYRRCAFFVLPSVDEGFGLVYLEAMRAGKACIGATGAASEIIEDGATGFVLDVELPRPLTRSLVALFNGRARRVAMGERGRERFESYFTSERFQDRLRQVLDAR